MKKTTITILCLAACLAAADTKITWLADVTADRAETVTGVQSGQVANAAAHIVRTDNPHGVTAPQIGALTAEQDLAALAADRFIPLDAGKNVISTDAGANANTTQSILIGDRAGNAVTGSTIIAIGRDAAREIVLPGAIGPEAELSIIAIGENAAEQAGGMWGFAHNIAIGNSAFKEGAGRSSITIGLNAGRTAAAEQMIAIGSDAGRTAAAEQMIAIGYQAGEQASLTNSVVIGANAGRLASGQNILVIDSSGNDDSSYPARAMIYGNANDLTLGRIDSNNNVLRGNWLFNNDQILTNETDETALAALAAYAAYWPRNATASSWFSYVTNSGAITITDYNIGGGVDVVIPDYINGWPVTTIGENAFAESGVTSIGGAGNVVMVGNTAFSDCYSLASVSLPQALTVGDYAFINCLSLTSVSMPQVQTVGAGALVSCGGLTSLYFNGKAPTIGANIFMGIPPNQVTNYVTNPQATGWGATFGGMPVVRLPLYADAIYQAGELVATTQQVAQAIASTCSQTCIRAWMPLTTHSQFGYVDLPAASNSTVALGPAPLNSFVVRVSVPGAFSGAQYTFSNIVLYAGSHTTPPESQGFTACTTGVFTASNWNLLSPTGYLMRRDDSKMRYGSARRDMLAYSLGMDEKVRLFCWWSPATPAELAAGTNVFYYGSDAQ